MIILGYAGLGALPAGGTEREAELQRALNELGTFQNEPALRVPVDGKITTATTLAVAAALPTIAGLMDGYTRIALLALSTLSLVIGTQATTDDPGAVQDAIQTANGLVYGNAEQITKAIRAYIAARTVISPPTPATPTPTPTPTGTKKPLTIRDQQLHALLTSQLAPASGGASDPAAIIATGTTINAFDPKLGLYRVAKPLGLSGFGAAATFVEVGTVTTPPANSTSIKLHDYLVAVGKLPWYRTTWGMGLLAAGGLTATVGVVLLVKRRHRKEG